MNNQLTIRLDDFEGPLDLLLHLIKTNQMDIYDIPIVEITDQYLAFLHAQEQLLLDVAGEYLVMATTLLRIKSRYLLPNPKPEIDQETGEEIFVDPRADLINQLLEYKRYQEAASELRSRESNRSLNYTRDSASLPEDIELTLLEPGIELIDLQKAFLRLLKRKETGQQLKTRINTDSYTIGDQMFKIKDQIKSLSDGQSINFEDLIFADNQISIDEAVTTFLAILELAKYHQILIDQDKNSDILIFKGQEFDTDQKIDESDFEDD